MRPLAQFFALDKARADNHIAVLALRAVSRSRRWVFRRWFTHKVTIWILRLVSASLALWLLDAMLTSNLLRLRRF